MQNKEIVKESIQMCKNFRLLREKKGLSIKELSEDSGVSEYMITNFENGMITKRASVTHIFKLCSFLRSLYIKFFRRWNRNKQKGTCRWPIVSYDIRR